VPTTKVAVTIDAQLLKQVDGWVAAGEYPSRSRAVQVALRLLSDQRAVRHSLLSELAKLDPEEERALAEEWLEAEAAWPTS
jgi:Arc/MetJ-type ribon-helix-helix transcriptional regulator